MSSNTLINVRQDLLAKIWRGYDPFLGFPRDLYARDTQGWGYHHAYLTEAIVELKPTIVVEVGVWKGASSIVMASKMKELGLNSALISVDTWLGAWDHWIDESWLPSLGFEFGQPTIMRKFMSNVLSENLHDTIIPLPLDSLNAAEMLRLRGIEIDILHLDGGHDYRAVISDLDAWWPLIKNGGLLIGDDYYNDGNWPGVKQAFDEFVSSKNLSPFEFGGGKCRVKKPR